MHYITLPYVTLHYITLHYIALRYIILQQQLQLQLQLQLPLNFTTRHYTSYITLHNSYNYTTLQIATLDYTTHHHTTVHNATVHYTNYTTPQLQLQLPVRRHYTNYTALQLQLHYATLHYTTLHYNYSYSYNCATPRYIHQLWWSDRCKHCHHSQKHNSNHTSVHQWIRSAIRHSQQPNSSKGFLFLKLPPPPSAVLLAVYIYIYSTTTISQTMNWSCHVWNSTLSKVAFRFVPTTQNSIVHETKLEHCANMFVLLLMPTIHNWVWDGMMFVQIKISTCFFLIGTIR